MTIFDFIASAIFSPGVSTYSFLIILPLTLLFFSILYSVVLSRRRKFQTGHLVLIGRGATVEEKLDPVGSVIVAGELWRAIADTTEANLITGSPVRIVGTQGHLLMVAPLAIE